MNSMSHQPAAGVIGSQLVAIASQGLDSAAASVTSLTGLIPAGGDEVSAQAAMAFAAEAAAMLTSNTGAQEEMMRTGTALTDIARMYTQADGDAAGALTVSGAAIARQLAGGSAAGLVAGLMNVEALPGAAGSAARTLLAGLIEAPSSPLGQAAGNIANTASTVGSSAAPLASMGQGAAAGSSQAGLAAVETPAKDEDEEQRAGRDDQQPGERVL
jgi:uncharacterized protein YukE